MLWVILMNTDLVTTFKTELTLCTVATLKLNQLLTSYCTTIIIQTSVKQYSWNLDNTFNIINEYLVIQRVILFGSSKFAEINNSHIINATIKYFLDSERFSGPLVFFYFTKHFDFGCICGWLILDFLFVFNANVYNKH